PRDAFLQRLFLALAAGELVGVDRRRARGGEPRVLGLLRLAQRRELVGEARVPLRALRRLLAERPVLGAHDAEQLLLARERPVHVGQLRARALLLAGAPGVLALEALALRGCREHRLLYRDELLGELLERGLTGRPGARRLREVLLVAQRFLHRL